MKIDVYSHAIKVSDVITERDLQAMFSFCKPLIEIGYEKKGKKFVPKKVRTFAAATRNRREFSFHRNQLNSLKNHLFKNFGYAEHLVPIVHHVVKLTDLPEVNFEVRKMFPPREKQVGIIEYVLDDQDPKWDPIIKMVTLQTGGGKATSDNTPIRIPGGWKRMGLVKVGDYVIGDDGKPTRVIGVYPQGKKQLYRVTFYDGRHVEVCGEHLWQSYYVNTVEHQRWQVRDTLELKRLIEMPNPRVYVPLLKPEDIPPQVLPIDPWVLGVLIGDGCVSGGDVSFSTPDDYIVDRMTRSMRFGQQVTKRHGITYGIVIGSARYNVIRESLRELGLMGCLAQDKFIPSMYLEASIEQRKELLKGLVDTDGYVNGHGTISYCTVSEQLAKDVQYLVRSLGGMARIRTKNPVYTHNGEKRDGQLAYNVYIRLPKPSDAVSLPKKLERVNDANQYSHKLKLQVKSIEPVGIEEATCIAVDNASKLFVVQDFIVTHNTFVAQYCMNKLRRRTVIHFKGGYVERWKSDLEETFKFKRGEFLIVRGSKDMIALQKMALEGTLEAKVIIITSATMRDYIKYYEDTNGSTKIYPIKPIDFYPTIGAGFRVTDELHQEFHNNYRIDLYTHIPKSLGLSATMTSSDAFKNRMYDIGYPVMQRHDGGGYNVYIAVTAVLYHMDPDVKIRYMGAQGYSHTTFEESLMRHKGLLKNYLKIVDHAIYHRFVSVREEGQTALVFFARVDLCTLMVERLRKMYPELNIVRYVGSENDSYEDFLEADIAVSTIGSAGTAVDKPNLRTSFMTTAIDSRQSNEQVLGRTRPLKDWPDVTPEFIYFGCLEIEQHMKYRRNKEEFFRGKVLSHMQLVSKYTLSLH